jgi:hypothetical protein
LSAVKSFGGIHTALSGVDERTVPRRARAENPARGARHVRGTKLDTGTYLDKLKSLSGSEQFTATKRALGLRIIAAGPTATITAPS